MGEEQYKIKEHKRQTISNAIGIVVVIAVLIGVNHFYFAPQTQLAEDLVVQPGLNIDINQSRQQFEAIQNNLLQNPRFLDLQKYHEWPLDPDEINHGVDQPFYQTINEDEASEPTEDGEVGT